MEGEIIILRCKNGAINHWENVNSSFVVYCNDLQSPLKHLLIEECNLQIRVTADDYNTTYRCIIEGNPPHMKDFMICRPSKYAIIYILSTST